MVTAVTGSENYTSNPAGFSVDHRITFLGDRFVSSTSLQFPGNSVGTVGWFGANFRFANIAPSASNDSATVAEDQVSAVSGNVLSNDFDPDGDTLTVAAGFAGTRVGTYGTLVLGNNGSYTYSLDNSSSIVQALAEGQQLTDSFDYQAFDGAVTTDLATLTITINGLNDAPVLSGANSFTTINEEQIANSGNSVSDLISGHATDVDAGALQGIAVTGLNPGNGTWQFSTNAGSTWTNVDPVSQASALLLRSEDRLRFLPDGQNGTSASLTFRAWDQSTGSAGTTADTTSAGGSTAFSTATATASITVADINDAPVLSGANSFTTITEDQNTLANTGNPVSDLIAGQITDADAGALQGIAVTGLTSGNGTWQYSTGGSFTAVGTVSNTSALLLRPSDRLRFLPNGLSGTTASVTFRAWDQSNGLTAGTKASTGTNGGNSAYSIATATSNITALDVNDAPLATVSNTVVYSDQTFNLSDYTKTVFTWGNGGTISEVQQLSGGNPGAYLRVTISVNTAASSANFARVAAVYIKNDAVYDPATQGAIAGINFSQDAILFSGVGNGEGIRPALMQDGKVFIGDPLQVSPNTHWTATVTNNRQPSNFFLPSEDTLPVSLRTLPDFSASGKPITLGFTRLNTTTGAPFTQVGGVDNWRAEVIPAAAGYRIGEDQPVTLDGTRSTDPDSTNPPLNNNDIVLYEWDLNYNGVTFNPTTSGSSPTVTFPDNFAARPIALRVTDSAGATSLATSTLEVRNFAPSLSVNNPALTISEGQTALNGGTYSDVPADTVTLSASTGTLVDNHDGTWSWSRNGADDLATNVTITAADEDGGQTQRTFSLNVNNVAPSFDAGPDDVLQPAVQGQLSRAISFTDPGLLDVHTVTVNFGDGSGDQTINLATGARNFALDHTYTTAGTYTVFVKVSDDDGGSQPDSFQVEVILNRPPVADAGGPYLANEGTTLTLEGSGSTDPDSTNPPSNNNDIALYEWDLDYDGVTFNADISGSSSTSVVAVPDNFASRTIALRVTDSHGESDIDTTTLEVQNVAPSLTVDAGSVTINEGQTASNGGTFGDVPADTVTLTASLGTIADNGDGTWSWSYASTDDLAATVTITARDEDGGERQVSFQLDVLNVAPTIQDATFAVAENAANGTVVGSITGADPGDDTLTYSISGGSGAFAINPSTGQITVADSSQLDYETTHSFALAIEVADNDGGISTATVTINLINQASISGVVFVDANGNGQFDGNELGIDGVTVKLIDSQGAEKIAVTSLGGYYVFDDLDPGVYDLQEMQPSGVTDGAESLGSLGGSIIANDRMRLSLTHDDAYDYAFAEIGQQVGHGDTATIGFWQNKNGQALIAQGGLQIGQWLTSTFGNVFGNSLSGATGVQVAEFYRDQLFKQLSQKSAGPARVDAQFMAVAFATFFTSRTLAGDVAAAYGFHVTDTGIGTKIVNVGSRGAAFAVANGTDLTILQLLQGTNALTDLPDSQAGFAYIYDQNGDGTIDAAETVLRTAANEMFTQINEGGDV